MKIKTILSLIMVAIIASHSYGFSAPNTVATDSLIIMTSLTDETCNLDNGTITITVVGDSTGVTYSIDNGITYTSNPYFTGLTAGDYLIIAQSTDCFAVQSAQIEDLDGPQLNVSAECVPGQNLISLSSGVNTSIPVTFNWEGPNNISYTDSIVAATIPGTYYVTITDNLGCTSESSVTLDACCVLNVNCNLQPIVESCTNVAPDPNPLLLDPAASTEDILEALLAEGIAIDTGLCGAITLDITDTPVVPSDCNDDIVIQRVYTITDNETDIDCSHQITLSDHVEIELFDDAQDLAVSCDSDFKEALSRWVDDKGGMTLNGCSDPYVFSTEPAIVSADDITCGELLEVVFTATDACGNAVSSTASFSIFDTEDPIINCPDPIEVNPVDPLLQATLDDWLKSVQVSDNCGDNPASNDLDLSKISTDCEDPAQIEVLFITEDDCGNMADCVSRVNVISPSAPAFNCAQDLFMNCDDDRAALVNDWISEFTAENPDGSSLPVDNNLVMNQVTDLGCDESIEITFSIEDECNRVIDCVKSISIIDPEIPEITCPAFLNLASSTLDGNDEVSLWLEEVVAVDNCTPDLLILNDLTQDFSDLCSMTDDTKVVFTVADDCGNETECESTITVSHNEPSLTCPAEITITCGDPGSTDLTTAWLDQASATENDDNPISNDFGNLAVVGCDDPVAIEFSTMDNCGQTASCTSTIKIIDQENPELTCPTDFTVNIESTNLQSEIDTWLDSAVASDCNSFELKHNFDADIIESFTCTEPVEINYGAEDVCGNISVCTTTLTIENLRELEITCPERIEIRCSDPLLNYKVEQHLEAVIVESNIGYSITEFITPDILTVSCTNSESVEIEIVALDECDNERSCLTGVDFVPDPQIYIPNVFTPNGDSVNDYFTAYGNESVDYIISMVIYNRWGSKIYESSNIDINEDSQGWDGQYAGQKEKTEVFTYLFKIMDLFGNEIEKVGTIQIISE